MRLSNPFAEGGAWLKAALHNHSAASDGELAPEAHVAHHEWAGFDVVALTDHWTLTRVASTERLLVLTGAELAVDPLGPGRYTEILAIGIEELPEDPGGDRAHWGPIDNYLFKTFPDLSAAAGYITGQGGAAYVAHPYWSGLPPHVVLDARGLTGIELFNGGAQRENGRGDSSYVWDLALEDGRELTAIATDDAHHPGFDIGDAWTMVRAEERSAPAVLDALRRGHTYASCGPAIHDVRRDGESVEVRCDPCRSVVFQSRYELGWAVRSDHRNREEGARVLERDDRGMVVRARFEPPPGTPDLPYLRVVVTDAEGRAAWTNPV
jgi:predicted metal-dependent phosphoesterase TrpH